jgi:hypothetical protein
MRYPNIHFVGSRVAYVGLTSTSERTRKNPNIGFGRSPPFGFNPHSEGTGSIPVELAFVSLVGLWPGQ